MSTVDLINQTDKLIREVKESITLAEARQHKWDKRFIELAKHIASWSKDPSTQTGAVIVEGMNNIVSFGYNGFAPGVYDDPAWLANRDIKYKVVLHCEENACLFANRPLHGCTLYTWPFGSCAHCSSIVIQKGIKRCVYPPMSDEIRKRWGDSLDLAESQFRQAGVELYVFKE